VPAFTYSIEGPAPLPDGIKYSEKFSVEVYTDPPTNAIIYFNTDNANVDNYSGVVLFIHDRVGNRYMTVNYLEQRHDDGEIFGFRFTPGGTLYTFSVPAGPVANIFLSYP
jgi:hypothetical protein